MRVVWAPHVDYVRVCTNAEPGECLFQERGTRWWRPGWWARRDVFEREGVTRVRCVADAEAAARSWPQAWALDSSHLTRVDIACDVTGIAFTPEMRCLFTCRGSRNMIERGGELRTLYIGSRESPVMLRIYLKSVAKNLDERTREHWRANGWNGRSPVWRIEYELHSRALPKNTTLPRDVPALWADCLARIRMCSADPRTASKSNQRRVPTHPWWTALGQAERLTRRGGRPTAPLPAGDLARLEAALDRLAVSAGVDYLPRLMARLKRHAR